MPPIPKSPSSYSLVIQTISARSRTFCCAEGELEVDDVLQGGALAGAGAVPNSDEEALPLAAAHPLDQLGESRRGLRGVLGGADRERVAVGAEPFGLVEAQLRAGRVDQEVVPHLLELPVRPRPHRLDGDVRGRVVPVASGWISRAHACSNSIPCRS